MQKTIEKASSTGKPRATLKDFLTDSRSQKGIRRVTGLGLKTDSVMETCWTTKTDSCSAICLDLETEIKMDWR